ncbi:MAG: hypothetical protein OEV92_02405 [Nitrospinota bacterium]|nr:hypothetical protein [Nitrospinota bacterium]
MEALVNNRAEGHLKKMLKAGGVRNKASYSVGDVARLLGVSRGTVVILCGLWEPETMAGRDMRGMDSYRTPGGHRRVPVGALVDWLERNNSYEREYGWDGGDGE